MRLLRPLLCFAFAIGSLAVPRAFAAGTVAEALAAEPCVISVAHGRNLSSDDSKFNEFWNTVNSSVGKFVNQELSAARVKVQAEFYPVEATDPDAKFRNLMKLAAQHKCGALLQIAAFSAAADELTVEITLNRLLVFQSQVSRGTATSVEEQLYARSYKYATDGDFAAKFVFSEVAVEYVRDLLVASAP